MEKRLYYTLLSLLVIIIATLIVIAAPNNGHDLADIGLSHLTSNVNGIGVGVQHPITKLHIGPRGGGTTSDISLGTERDNRAVLKYDSGQTNMFSIDILDPSNTFFKVFNIRNGNVGVGTTTPSAKLHVAGDTLIEGNLLGAATTLDGTPLRTVCGKTDPGTTPWFVYSPTGVSLIVDISAAGFTETPIIISSIGGSSSHWFATGESSIYGIGSESPLPTKDNFRIYVTMKDDRALTPTTVNSWQWYVNWCATGK